MQTRSGRAIGYQERVWKNFGERDPYWAVLTRPEYHGTLTEEARSRFFASGEEHLSSVLATIKRIAPFFNPSTALDFGCGVGRIAIPMARRFKTMGVDVSPGMLAEAARNSAEYGMDIHLGYKADRTFDFIHSFIVFQHIPQWMGLPLIDDLLGRLNNGGVAAIHLIYRSDASNLRKAARLLRYKVPAVNYLANVVQGRPWDDPRTEMHVYPLNEVLGMCYRHGIMSIYMDNPRQEEWEEKAVMMYAIKTS